jgi:hypothetical protein
MNALTTPATEAPMLPTQTNTAALILQGDAMDKMMATARLMASSKVTIPQHLRNEGDCLAVVLQGVQWGMNPFSIAQKTFLSPDGKLSYEAQLINAVIVGTGAIQGQPSYEFIGDWNKVIGKVQERKSDKGGKYYVANWNEQDEDGLGVIVRATLAGETEPRELQLLLKQCYPRFSTQWATDPQQQICFAGVRKFARRYAPGAILGLYTPEELESVPAEIDVTPGAPEKEPQGKKPDANPAYTAEQMRDNKPTWEKAIKAGTNTPAGIISKISSKYTLTEDQKREIHNLGAIEGNAEVMAHEEDVKAMLDSAEAAAISQTDIKKQLGVESLDNLTMAQLEKACAFIANPA